MRLSAALLLPGVAFAQPFADTAAWPFPAHDSGNGAGSQHILALNDSPTVVWSTDLLGGAIHGVSIDQDDVVFAIDAAGRAVSIDSDGSVVWSSEPYGTVGGPPTVIGRSGDGTDDGGWMPYDVMYMGTASGEILGLSAIDGSEVLRFNAGQGPVTTSILVRNHIALNGTSAFFGAGSTLTAVSIRDTPALRYTYDFGEGEVNMPAYGFCTIVASSSANGGSLINLNPHMFPGYGPTDGEQVCYMLREVKFNVTLPHGEVSTVLAGDTVRPGGIGGLMIVASAEQGTVECVETLTGERQWSYALPTGALLSKGSPAVSPNAELIFVGGADGVLYALDPLDGTLAWSYDTGPSPIFSRVAVDAAGSIVLVAGSDVLMVSFQGELLGRYEGDTPVTTPPSINGEGQIVYGDGDGITCLSF